MSKNNVTFLFYRHEKGGTPPIINVQSLTHLGGPKISGRFDAEEWLRGTRRASGAPPLLPCTPRNVRGGVADESDFFTGRVKFGQRVSEPQ